MRHGPCGWKTLQQDQPAQIFEGGHSRSPEQLSALPGDMRLCKENYRGLRLQMPTSMSGSGTGPIGSAGKSFSRNATFLLRSTSSMIIDWPMIHTGHPRNSNSRRRRGRFPGQREALSSPLDPFEMTKRRQ